nr:hypothetical protein [Acidimicrobiia bacterium]
MYLIIPHITEIADTRNPLLKAVPIRNGWVYELTQSYLLLKSKLYRSRHRGDLSIVELLQNL